MATDFETRSAESCNQRIYGRGTEKQTLKLAGYGKMDAPFGAAVFKQAAFAARFLQKPSCRQ